MARLLRPLAAAVLALLPAVAWAAVPGPGMTPAAPGLWLAGDKHDGGDKHGGGSSSYRSACERAARDRGWHVRSVGQFSKMDGPNGGTYHALVQVRDGRHSFEALCEASADGSFAGLKRRG